MTITPGSLLARAFAVGLVIVVFGVLAIIGVRPIATRVSALKAEQSDLVSGYEHYRRIADQLGSIEEKTRDDHRKLTQSQLYFDEQSRDVAAAKLQNLASAIIRNHNALVQLAQRRVTQEDNHTTTITIGLNFSSSYKGLLSVLHDIGEAKPTILIDSLGIRSSLRPGTQNADGGPFQDDLILNVEMQLSAFATRVNQS